MKKAKKLISLVLSGAMLASVASLAACGGGGETGDGKITYYMWGSRKEVETAQQLAADFKLLHPEWTVEVQPSTGNYYDNLKTNFGGGNAPDLFFMEGGMIESFIRDGMLLELDSYIESSEFFKKEDMWDVNDCYRYNAETNRMGSGKLYAIIKDLTPDFMMIYNKKHIDDYDEDHAVSLAEEVGYPTDESGKYPSPDVAMTWAQCTEMCQLLTVTDGQGNITRYGTTLDQVPWKHVMEWIQMGDDTLFTEDMKNFNKDSQAVYDAFEYFVKFQDGETKSAAAVASGSVGGGESFKNGDVSVNWNGRWAFQSYGWYDVNFEIGVAPPPTPNGGSDIYCATTMISHAINAASPDKDVAYAFLEYYMTVGMNAYVQTGYNIPGNKTIAYNQFLNVTDPYQKALNEYFIEHLEKASPIVYNFYIDQSRVEGILGDYIPRVWAKDSADRLTLRQALDQAAAEIDTVISRNFR